MSTTTSERRERFPKPKRTAPIFSTSTTTRALAPGALACASCGVGVADAVEVERLRPTYGEFSGGGVHEMRPQITVPLTRCTDCGARRERAAALVAELHLGAIYGLEQGVDLLDAALAGLDVLGIRGAVPVSFTRDRASVRQLIDSFAHRGSAATWGAAFMPVVRMGAQPDSGAVRRWSHVAPAMVRDLRDAYAALIEKITEPTFDTTPPTDAEVLGCALCGVATIPGKPSTAGEVWGVARMVDPATVGGRPAPTQRRAYVCPRCRRAVAGPFGSDEPVAIGMAAVERALLAHLGLKVTPGWTLTPRGVYGFAALKPGTPGSAKPWAHLDTEALAARLRRSVAVHPVQR